MLTDQQIKSIDLKVAGVRGTEIERTVGISHTQYHRWKKDPEYLARVEEQRVMRHEERAEKLWSMADRALDVIAKSLDEEDPRAAMDVLRLVARGITDVHHISADRPGEPALPLPASPEPRSREFVCGSCGRSCKTAAGLTSHERTHAA